MNWSAQSRARLARIIAGASLALLLASCGRWATLPPTALASPQTENSASYLYVASWGFGSGGDIDIFLRDDPSKGPIDIIRAGINIPDGIFVDREANLYVTNGNLSGRESVEVYARGGHKPERYYTGVTCAFDVIAAADGTVYIADACGGKDSVGRVAVYLPGKTKPSRYLYPGASPYCLAFDAHNDLYVGTNSGGNYVGQVVRYKPGAKKGVDVISGYDLRFITGLAVDDKGALLVGTEAGGYIDVFSKVGQPPSRVIKTGQSHPFRFAFDRLEDTLYVSDICVDGSAKALSSSSCSGPGRPNTVVAIDYATGNRMWTIKGGQRVRDFRPSGVAVFPGVPF